MRDVRRAGLIVQIEREAPLRVSACVKDRYDAQVDGLIAGAFSEGAINDKFDRWSALIADAVDEADGKGGAPKPNQWRHSVMELREVIAHSRATRGRWPDTDHLPRNTDLPDVEGD